MYGPYEIVDTPVICPYNVHHKIARSRIQRHIVKCEKHYPEDYKVICPYNASHRLFKSEVRDHIVTCPMRRLIDPELYQWTKKHGSIRSKLQSDVTSTIDYEENFDNEINHVSEPNVNNNDYDMEEARGTVRVCNADLSHLEDKELRAPRGFSEAMLTDQNDDIKAEDMESVISSMGMGRGKFDKRNMGVYENIGLGRGKPFNL